MISGRFFKYKYQDNDISSYYYSRIILAEDDFKAGKNHPVYATISDELISFYLTARKVDANKPSQDSSSLNHLLFEIPLDNDLDNKFFLNLLETIFEEDLKEYSHIIEVDSDYRFKGYRENYTLNKYSKAYIFLDFLFDLIHSQVFDTYANLSALRKFFSNNFLMNAIISRCDYLFCKSEYIKVAEDDEFGEKLFSARFKSLIAMMLKMK